MSNYINANSYEYSINQMLAIASTIENLDKLDADFEELVKKTNKNLSEILKSINIYLFFQKKFINPKIKKFCNNNSETISLIRPNFFDAISDFLQFNYDKYGDKRASYSYLKEYISNHLEELPNIINLLNRIKELDINWVHFGLSYDFTDEEHEYHSPLYYIGAENIFLDNMIYVPNIEGLPKYKSTFSNYKIVTESAWFRQRKVIYLNSLLFDPSRLPNEISNKALEKLTNPSHQDKETYDKLKDIVELSSNIENMSKEIELIQKLIINLDNNLNRSPIYDTIETIMNSIDILREHAQNVEDEFIYGNQLITKEKFAEEKKTYQKTIKK